MNKKIILFLIALIPFTIVVLNIYLWIDISNHSNSFQQAKYEWLEKFPNVLQNARLITILNILFLSIAAFLFYKTQNVPKLKLVSLFFFAISVLLIAWQVFSLM